MYCGETQGLFTNLCVAWHNFTPHSPIWLGLTNLLLQAENNNMCPGEIGRAVQLSAVPKHTETALSGKGSRKKKFFKRL